jgi:hypothetical protein
LLGRGEGFEIVHGRFDHEQTLRFPMTIEITEGESQQIAGILATHMREPHTCCSCKREVCNEMVVLCPESEKYYVERMSMTLHARLSCLRPRSARVNPPIAFDTKFQPFHE